MFWRPNREEIEEWIERKQQDFAREQNRNTRINNEQWLQRYVFTDLHEIFFGEFPIILTKWLERLVKNVGRYRTKSSRNWTPTLIKQLNMVSNKVSHIIDFWLSSILGGYITKFAVYCT
jgi:tRNA(His) 5'-end guanylyltransferase